jgi:hypothetical protein
VLPWGLPRETRSRATVTVALPFRRFATQNRVKGGVGKGHNGHADMAKDDGCGRFWMSIWRKMALFATGVREKNKQGKGMKHFENILFENQPCNSLK